jgi:hypothetical protein
MIGCINIGKRLRNRKGVKAEQPEQFQPHVPYFTLPPFSPRLGP